MWVLVMQASPCHSSYQLHHLQTQGQLAGEFLSCLISTINYLIIWLAGSVSLSKEENQMISEQLLRHNIISQLLGSSGDFSSFIPMKSVSRLMNVLSELVLTNTKFMNQV